MSRLIRSFTVTAIAAMVLMAGIAAQQATAGTTGGIQGYVTDGLGKAIAGVQVSAAAPSFATRTITGANGFYAMNGLPLDTYTLTFTKSGYLSQSIPGITTVQDQTSRINARLDTEAKTLGKVTVRGTTSLIQPTQTANTYVVNQTTLSNLNGTPQDPNGFQAFNSLPGVTTDNAGYPVIRAGQENDVGYQLDGVDNTDPVTGQFLNAVTLNGARSVQLSTGGYDVSAGNTNSGVINEVIDHGAYPGSGEATARAFFSTYGHELSLDYGNATPDNKFSYYFSYDGQRDGQEYGDKRSLLPLYVAFGDFTTTNDEVLNLFYRLGRDNRDEIQLLSNLSSQTFGFGFEVNGKIAPYAGNNQNVQINSEPILDNFGDTLPVPQSDYFTLYPGQVTPHQNIGVADDQTFSSVIDKLNFKRQLSPSSYAEFTLHKTIENLIFRYPYDVGSFSDFYEDLQTQGTGLGFDYANQISDKHSIGFGGDMTYYGSKYSAGFPSSESFYEPLSDIGCPQLLDNGGTGVGGCYIAPFNRAMNQANGGPFLDGTLPTDAAHAPLSTYVDDLSVSNDPIHRYDLFVKDRYQPNQRLTLTAGLRFDKQVYGLPANAAQANTSYFYNDAGNLVTVPGKPFSSDITAPSQISPRFAAAYQLGRSDVLRFSVGQNIEFATLSAVEDKYRVPTSLQNCNIANGCFIPLPGGPGTVPAGQETNHITNLYQQMNLDLTTNEFAQYTPVRPQHAINYDASWEHEFGGGTELRITPYYRKGTDYIVGNSPLLTTLASGQPVFGAAREENAGVNENTGVEFALQSQHRLGLSTSLAVTYDNTFANYDSDFFPFVNNAALAANHFFHVSYVAPITATANLVYDSPHGFHISATVPYESGYRYGVGKKVYIFTTNAKGQSVPQLVLNTDLANGYTNAYYYTDPNDPGTEQQPNIIGSRGTPEGDDPGTLHGVANTYLNLSISQDIGPKDRGYQIGLRVENLLGNYNPSSPSNNIWYENCGFGKPCGPNNSLGNPVSGTNLNAGLEPFQYNYGRAPYENEQTGLPREFTVFLSMKY
ncbi:MAG TPA: TonB-dependent receptor [Candidatus Eremiobacteraceae bacterium]